MKLISFLAVIHVAKSFSIKPRGVRSLGSISIANHLFTPADEIGQVHQDLVLAHEDHVIPPDKRPAVAKARREKIGIKREDVRNHEDDVIPTKKRPIVAKSRREKLGLPDKFIEDNLELEDESFSLGWPDFDIGTAIRLAKSLIAP